MSGVALRWVRGLAVVALSVAVLVAAAGTIHWPIVGDAPLFHYIAFLIDHGKVPYRDIVDINMPGTYAMQWAAIHVLGPGALAWRFFDFGLVALTGAAMVVITRREDWLAGFFAGAMFALIHFRDGPTHTGQRDLMMTAMLLPACAALFETVLRSGRSRVVMAGVFAVFVGMAAVIKPSGVLFAALLGVLLWMRLRGRVAGVLATAAAGFLLPVLACVAYMVRHGALRAFVETNRGLVAYHAALGRPSLAALVVGSFPSVLLAVVVPAVPLFVAAKVWRGWRARLVLGCTVLGALSYVLQGKGFPYHRYPTEAFLLLGCGVLLFGGLQQMLWKQRVAIAGVLLGVLYLAPASAAIACRYDWRNQEFNNELAADLNGLGDAAGLQGEVQCVDMTAGCLNTLYNQRIVQATGFLYDCYLFQPQQTPVSVRYREDFWRALSATRPRVLVVTDQQCFAMTRDWSQPERWPQFAALLRTDYTLVKQYTPPHLVAWWRKPAVPYSYRLYVRKGEPPSQPK